MEGFVGAMLEGTVGLMGRALDLRMDSQRASSANIANQDTPYYKAIEVPFEEAMRASLPSSSVLPLTTTHPGHLSSLEAILSPSSGVAVLSPDPPVRLDGNNVNAEKEMARMMENQLMYNATIQLLSQKMQGLGSAIREGR